MHMLIGHLHDFSHSMPRRAGAEAAKEASPTPLIKPAASPAIAPPKPAVSSGPDLAAIAAQAAAEGRRAGAADARVEFERLRTEDMARAEQRVAEERRNWIDAESDRLAGAIDSGLEALRQELAQSLARLIGPFLQTAVRERALVEMAAVINDTLTGSDNPVMRVTGSPDLIDELRTRIDPRAPVSFEPGSQSEVIVTVGATTLETQMQAWTARLGAATAGDE